MGRIVRSGYVSDAEKQARQRFYNSSAWKSARAAVVARAGNRCEWCGNMSTLDAVHLGGRTLDLIRRGVALEPSELAAGCRRCHSNYQAGNLGRPPGR
jgi:hypothetical protein